MLIKILITGLVYALLLSLLSRFKSFSLRPGGLFAVTLILMLVDWLLGAVLGFFAWIPKILTLGLLNPIIDWFIKVIIFWVTDKLSDSLKITSLGMLLGSGLALSIASYVVSLIVK